MFGGIPSSSRSPASAPIAVIVPSVSKKSERSRVNTKRAEMTMPAFSQDPRRLNSPSSCRSGVSKMSAGQAGTLRFQPSGLNCSPATVGPMSAIVSTMIATTVITTIEIRIAPFTRST